MAANVLSGVVKLTSDQYVSLKTNGQITVKGTTYRFDPYTIYVTTDDDSSLNSNYLPISGGTMSGPLVITGGDAATAGKIILDDKNRGQITNSSTATLFGFNSSTQLTIGASSYTIALRGSATRPTYNGNNMALYSDIPTNHVDTSSNQTIAGTKTFSNSIIAPQFKSDNTEAGMYFGSNNELDFGSNGSTLYIGYQNRLGTTGAVSQWWFGRSNGSAGWRSGDIHSGSVNLFSTSTNKSWNVSQNVNGDLVFNLV